MIIGAKRRLKHFATFADQFINSIENGHLQQRGVIWVQDKGQWRQYFLKQITALIIFICSKPKRGQLLIDGLPEMNISDTIFKFNTQNFSISSR